MTNGQQSLKQFLNQKKLLPSTDIKNIIGIISGKGGVGKSFISATIAVNLARKGYRVGILDADITGPSIPKLFNLPNGSSHGDDKGIFPALSTKYKIKIISVNLMLENEDTPVLWRGPIIGNMVNQFYTETYWQELDYLIIDMPPGTGDVALSVIQSIPLDGLICVSGPGELISMIVSKAIVMAKKTDIKIIGIVENMAYIECPCCHNEIHLYRDNTDKVCQKYDLRLLARIPTKIEYAQLADSGLIEDWDGQELNNCILEIEKLSEIKKP